MPLPIEEMARVARFLPTKAELADHFGVDVKTIEARLRDQPGLAQALINGKARGMGRLSRTQLKLANGFFRCEKCHRMLDDDGEVPSKPTSKCDEHPTAERFFIMPQPVSSIWAGKQHLGQADRSFLETRFGGDLSKIKEDELLALAREAIETLEGVPGEEPDTEEDEEDGSNG